MGRLSLEAQREQIIAFCRHWKVSEFSLFGSALREFRSDSDITVFIAFLPGAGDGGCSITHR